MNNAADMHELRKLDLNLLVVFQHLLEERNISAVARRLDLSQPAVSNALRRLRQAFGDEALHRPPAHGGDSPGPRQAAGDGGELLARRPLGCGLLVADLDVHDSLSRHPDHAASVKAA